MLLTTTPTVEGKPIQQYIGIVTAESIIGANIFKDIFAGIRDIVGGRSGTYERVIEEARQNALVELTLESETYISAVDLKRIHESHDGIIHIIPVISKQADTATCSQSINLDQDIKDLFKDYFKSKYGQEPNSELLDLFDEVSTNTLEKED